MENIKVTNANEARSLAEKQRGQTSVGLYNPISFTGVKKLMELGFSVSEVFHPMELRTVQKISW
jgi:hypothetical protein